MSMWSCRNEPVFGVGIAVAGDGQRDRDVPVKRPPLAQRLHVDRGWPTAARLGVLAERDMGGAGGFDRGDERVALACDLSDEVGEGAV